MVTLLFSTFCSCTTTRGKINAQCDFVSSKLNKKRRKKKNRVFGPVLSHSWETMSHIGGEKQNLLSFCHFILPKTIGPVQSPNFYAAKTNWFPENSAGLPRPFASTRAWDRKFLSDTARVAVIPIAGGRCGSSGRHFRSLARRTGPRTVVRGQMSKSPTASRRNSRRPIWWWISPGRKEKKHCIISESNQSIKPSQTRQTSGQKSSEKNEVKIWLGLALNILDLYSNRMNVPRFWRFFANCIST